MFVWLAINLSGDVSLSGVIRVIIFSRRVNADWPLRLFISR